MENMGEKSHGSLGQRLFGTKQKKLAWGGAGALAVSAIVIVVVVLSSKSGNQVKAGLQADSKRTSHTVTGLSSRPLARKAKVNPDGTPKHDTSKSAESSSSTSEEEEGEHNGDSAKLKDNGKKAGERSPKVKAEQENDGKIQPVKHAQPEAEKDRSTPIIQKAEELLLQALDKLKIEGSITGNVSQEISDVTLEKMAEYLKELKANGRDEDCKDLITKYTKANAGDATKVKAVATIFAIGETINFIKSDSNLNSLFTSTVPEVLVSIEKATSIEQVLDSINLNMKAFFFHEEPIKVLIKAFSSYLQVKGESETVLKALQTLQNSQDIKLKKQSPKEKLQQANAWAEVVLHIKDESDLAMFRKSVGNGDIKISLLLYSCYPYSLFDDQKQIEILRIFTKEQTKSLTKSKNLKELLHNLSQVDLSHSPCKLNDYVLALSSLYEGNSFSRGLKNLSSQLTFYGGDRAPVLLHELLGKRLERVPPRPEFYALWRWVPDALRNFADSFEKEGDKKEADEWREYALEADLMFSIGLPREEKYKSVFDLYKTYRMGDASKETLSLLLNEFATLEPQYKEMSKFLLINITPPICVAKLLYSSFYNKTFSADKTAQNIVNSSVITFCPQINDESRLCYQFPLLVGVLEDDVVEKFCENCPHPFRFPAIMGFKESDEFKEFAAAHRAFFEKVQFCLRPDTFEIKKIVDEKMKDIVLPDFSPNIGFLDRKIYQNMKEEAGALIEAYEKLVGIMATYDSAIAKKMKEHIKKVKEDCFKLATK